MKKITLYDFIESFDFLSTVIDKNKYVEKIKSKRLPVEFAKLPPPIEKFKYLDIFQSDVELEENIYRSFLERNFIYDELVLIEKNVQILNQYFSKSEELKKDIHRFICQLRDEFRTGNFKTYYERLFELLITAYYGKIGRLRGIERKVNKSSKKSPDMWLSISGKDVFIEIYSLSMTGEYNTYLRGKNKISRVIKEIFDIPITFDIHPTNYFKGSAHQIKIIRKELVKTKQSVTKSIENGGKYLLTINYIVSGKRKQLVELKLMADSQYRGERISSINEGNFIDVGHAIKNIEEKCSKSKGKFPPGTLNFLLVNIAPQNQSIGWSYVIVDKSNQEMVENYKSGRIKYNRFEDITNFEKQLSNHQFDTNLTGLILHRFPNMDFKNHSQKVIINTSSKIKTSDIKEIVLVIEKA